jgi:hypothetical protein
MRNYIIIAIGLVLITGCSKQSTPALAPGRATLLLPAENSACTTGNIISTTKSAVLFTWVPTANTDTYVVGIKNLLTQAIEYKQVATAQVTDTLLRNTPYSWFVVSASKTSSDTAKSPVWKFYNAGPGAIAHAPYAANAVAPTLNQNVTAAGGLLNLVWNGSSIDNDITGYDVYFGTSSTPPLLKANVTDMFLNSVSVTSGTTYYWKIVTKDLPGNTSDSGPFSFKVN